MALPPLPPIPELGMTREAIAAALGEDPPAQAGQERGRRCTERTTRGPGPAADRPPSRPPRPAAAAPTITPASSPQRGPGGPRYRGPLAIRSRPRVQLRGPRRRVVLPGRGLPMQIRSNGGAGTFFVGVLIVFVALLYFIIAGIVESIVRLLP